MISTLFETLAAALAGVAEIISPSGTATLGPPQTIDQAAIARPPLPAPAVSIPVVPETAQPPAPAVLDVPKASDTPAASKPAAPAPTPELRPYAYRPDRRSWVSAEYLLWRIKSQPAPIPLVTTNNDPTTIAGLNEAGTTILFGAGSGRSTNPGWMSGSRFTLGAWFDNESRLGWEATGLVLERRNRSFDFASPGAVPVIAIPINATVPFNGNPAGETTLNSGGLANVVSVSINSRLWGAEANSILSLWSSDRARVTGLVGFRYIDLNENLTLSEAVPDPATNGLAVAVDGFGTRNQFYSGQIGARVEWTYGRWSLDATGKIALGSMHQVSNIAGATTVTNGAFGNPTGTTAGGLFAEPSNIGTTSRNVFAVAPEVTFQVGYDLTPRLRSFVGYNFIYMSSVLRPGNQMDRNVNPTQNSFLVPPGTLTGPAAPVPFFRSADFWAQGFNFGLEFKF